ncbi:aminotransferase class V-fold PLP-dependent enzyme [uncultured Desulfosarcina sp.]|uniref:pyridoxal phosphate-dependent decarboxylase family protein n=1 Tax=uncultured Desulfosarcina sp. TaxID=218289 RepID=UPI0029C77400|nr:aminotransferase class V-fold PLP-dependent enzyme [uncultured Desulfosarcina sp.]
MGYFGSDHEETFETNIFPIQGRPEEEVLARLDAFSERDVGEISGHSIVYGTQLMNHMDAARIAKVANMKFVKKNMLYKELMAGTERMTLEVKRMIQEMLGFPDGVRIRLTSGGSESLYCAINAAYQWARQEKPKMRKPEIVAPYTIHAAFSKWCHYTGIRLKRVALGKDFRADVSAMQAAVTRDTFMIVGSAPCWPYGLYDDLPAIAAVAEKRNLWMHVDACLGGFLAPFTEKAGQKLPPWGFGISGVRSISADLHKYGFSCKPLSSIAYRNKDWEQYHEYAPADWPDGPYTTEAICGSTTAGPIASAWAVMQFLGEAGYVDLARRCIEVKQRYTDGINAIDGCRCWHSDLTPMVYEVPRGMDMFAVMGGLFERQAYCLPGFQPPVIKVIIDPVTDEVVDRYIEALQEVIPEVRAGKITIESIRPYI